MRILLTGAGRRIELLQAFRNAALVLQKELKIYGADMTMTAPALMYCDCIKIVPPMNAPEYIDSLMKICSDEGIDLVIPTIDTDLMILSQNRERFEALGTRVMVSAPDKIRICRDKNLTARFFEENGLKTPATVHDIRDYQSGFPAFIKPKDGSSSIKAFRAEDEEELKIYASLIKDYIIQPFIEGREYTIDIFCDWEGTPVSIVPRERLQVRAGEVLKTKITLDQKMIAECRRLMAAFMPRGPVTVQLIRDRHGEDWFIEINPRFGGGAPLSMKAGARTAETILKLVDGEPVRPFEAIEDGAVYSRFDQSVCISVGECELKGVIFDLDDTLYPETDYVKSGFKAVSEYLGGGHEEMLMRFFEEGKPAIDELLKALGKEEKKEEALQVYRSHKPEIRLFEGAGEMLQALKDKGIKLGVLTDGRPEGQQNKIDALGLKDLVDDIIITDTLGGTQFRKPCDIAFRILQNRWRLPAGQIVYVGDNPLKDFLAPLELGMKSICFRNEEGLYKDQAVREDYRCVHGIEELSAIFGLDR